MRLDKFIGQSTNLSRAEAKRVLKMAKIKVDGEVTKSAKQHIDIDQIVTLDDVIISVRSQRYIMLHKPENFICSNVDEIHPSVLNLLDVDKRNSLHIAGRLDVDTTGLVLITDDGQWSHLITSPKKHCSKMYLVTLAEPITELQRATLEKGVLLKGEDELTQQAQLDVLSPHKVKLQIHEGKYHQVKRMFAAVGNHVVKLHRAQIGNLALDDNLLEGQWRYLTDIEVAGAIKST